MTKINKAKTAETEGAENLQKVDEVQAESETTNTVVVVDEAPTESPKDEPKEEPKEDTAGEVITDKEVPSIVPERNVKIKPKATFSSVIGGTRYFFVKDKVITVPEEVKRILNSQNLLNPI